MGIITRKGNLSVYCFGNSVALSGERALIGVHVSDEKGVNSGLEYIFHRENGLW